MTTIIKFETQETAAGCMVTKIGQKHTRTKQCENKSLAKQWIADQISCILETIEIAGLADAEIWIDGELCNTDTL